MTEITRLLGINHPIILGAMRYITLADMAAAISNIGCFGQIAVSSLSSDQLRAEIEKARKLTSAVFGLNIPLHRANAMEAVEIAAEMKIPAITTSGGNPAKIMEKAKEYGLIVLHKVSNTAMGLKAQDAGADGVIATGFEAGGHGGKDKITTFCLVPQLKDVLKIPVVASGGISDGRTLAAAFALGADGAEIGTRFLASVECPVPDYYKQAVVAAADNSTINLGHGKMSIRVLRNLAVEKLTNPEASELNSLQPVDYSSPEANAETGVMPAGMGAGLIHDVTPANEIIEKMMAHAMDVCARLEGVFKGEPL